MSRQIVHEVGNGGLPNRVCNGPCANSDYYITWTGYNGYGLTEWRQFGNYLVKSYGYNKWLQVTSIEAGAGSLFQLVNYYTGGATTGTLWARRWWSLSTNPLRCVAGPARISNRGIEFVPDSFTG